MRGRSFVPQGPVQREVLVHGTTLGETETQAALVQACRTPPSANIPSLDDFRCADGRTWANIPSPDGSCHTPIRTKRTLRRMTECSKCRTPGTRKTRPRTGNPARPTRTAPKTRPRTSNPARHTRTAPKTRPRTSNPAPATRTDPGNPTPDGQPAAYLALSPPRTEARTYNSGETRREVLSLIAHR
ncbi:hypothetical protein GCM10022204_04370 [Microlunatus aurantiacus]|uniref:Uncharacterized protein n=1 Tax=Microlunatus aurantiacus TaxID=446786 RepID=A0ABP7CPK2_9ACTN